MPVLTFIVRELPCGEPFEITDMYWFEENGVHEIVDSIGDGQSCRYFIFVKK